MAEVDGNRTRRTRIARPNRFEGGGAHQVPGHLRRRIYWQTEMDSYAAAMKRMILLVAIIAMVVVAAKKVRSS